MASRTVSVKISGPALSLLLYENINALYEQEGFLLGNVTTTVTKSVTDDSREEIKIREIINVTGVLPCDLPTMYYKSDGELIEDKLNEMLGAQKKNVLAWFKYKKYRKMGFRFTVREKILHEEFMRFFDIPPHLFTCCILTSGTNESKSTQVFSHAFVNILENQLRMIPMHIENLGDPCHIYQPNSKPSEAFMTLFNKINKNQTDLQLGTEIHNQLQTELKKSITHLASTEQKLSQLRSEVSSLTKTLKRASVVKNLLSNEKNNMNECNKIEVEAPVVENEKITPTRDDLNIIETIEAGPDVDVQSKLDESDVADKTAVVDLTLSEDEGEKPARKTRSQRTKTVKSKRGARNS